MLDKIDIENNIQNEANQSEKPEISKKHMMKCMTFKDAIDVKPDIPKEDKILIDPLLNDKSNGSTTNLTDQNLPTQPKQETEEAQNPFFKNDILAKLKSENLENRDVKSCPRLQVFDIDGGLLWKKKLNINCLGLETGLRRKKDGITYFGPIREFNNDIVNDFVVNEDCTNLVLNYFAIFFIKETNSYMIKNLSRNAVFTYYKMYEPIAIKGTNNIFLIGDVQLIIDADYLEE